MTAKTTTKAKAKAKTKAKPKAKTKPVSTRKPKAKPEPMLEVVKPQETKKKVRYAEHYLEIGKMIKKNIPYRDIVAKLRGYDVGESGGAALSAHINGKFKSKEGFLIHCERLEEDENRDIRKEIEDRVRLEMHEEMEKQISVFEDKLETMEKNLAHNLVVIYLCEQKLSKKKVDELHKIASLFVNNFKLESDSMIAIGEIINGIESYITEPDTVLNDS